MKNVEGKLGDNLYGHKDDTFLNEYIGTELLPNKNVNDIITHTQVFNAYYIM